MTTRADLREQLDQSERDEEWALIVFIGWLILLALIVTVLLFSPVPWGALVGLVFWVWGARGVYRSFTQAVAHTAELRKEVENLAADPS